MPAPFYFCDVSHHKGDLDISVLARAGHRLLGVKASDNYHLPNKDGIYNIPAEWHTDAWFKDNFVKARKQGMVAMPYHFCRWDRPLPVSNRTAIVEANLRYFQDAIATLPEEYQDVECVVLDMEQSATQLNAANLTAASVSSMARDMVELFFEQYPRLILYSGSWWSDVWLTQATTEWMAERMMVWEPEYPSANPAYFVDGKYPPDPNRAISIPKGFINEYATSADDIGKVFAWQYTDKGNWFGPSNIDTNLYHMPKDQLYLMFGMDGAVDPPGTDPNPPQECDYEEVIADLFSLMDLNTQSGLDMQKAIIALADKYENK